jgi:GMP synthase-like glutamine amidotransferase
LSVLILKNTVTEGPGTIGGHLRDNAIPSTVVELEEGETVPVPGGFDTVVMLGGPMGVYETGKHPHLETGARIIREAIGTGKRVLGICLGAQVIAHVLGARVYRGRAEETGWFDIELTDDGLSDPVMGSLVEGDERSVRVLHWHGDTFDMPAGAVRLAGSELYANQAFRYGENAYALQFHMEVTREMVAEWFSGRQDCENIMRETEEVYEGYLRKATRFYREFFS